MKKHPNRKTEAAYSAAAVEETLRLYDGWLSYLLNRLGLSTVRVEAEELRAALATLSCRVERDGSGYVIHLGNRAEGGDARERDGAGVSPDNA